MEDWKCPQYDQCSAQYVQDCQYWCKENEHRLFCKLVIVNETVKLTRPVGRK